PYMSNEDAQNLIEEIISCANTIPKNMLDEKSDNIYVNAYFELVAYIRQLFVTYDRKISENDLSGGDVTNWGWYKLIKEAFNNEKYEKIYIITYNYDVFLERVLLAHNIPFDVLGIGEQNNKIQFIKPHGSISF